MTLVPHADNVKRCGPLGVPLRKTFDAEASVSCLLLYDIVNVTGKRHLIGILEDSNIPHPFDQAHVLTALVAAKQVSKTELECLFHKQYLTEGVLPTSPKN